MKKFNKYTSQHSKPSKPPPPIQILLWRPPHLPFLIHCGSHIAMNNSTILPKESNPRITGCHESKEGNEFTDKRRAISGIDEIVAVGVIEFGRGGKTTEEVDVVGVKGLEIGCGEGGEVY